MVSKIKDLAIEELNTIKINDIEDEGFIIDLTKVGSSETTTSWKVDLLYNTFQIVLNFFKVEDKNGIRSYFDVQFSEIVLSETDKNNILNFLINNIN